eukprot:scaffold62451_cov28-Tisochrysis_lutea.AAC.5
MPRSRDKTRRTWMVLSNCSAAGCLATVAWTCRFPEASRGKRACATSAGSRPKVGASASGCARSLGSLPVLRNLTV